MYRPTYLYYSWLEVTVLCSLFLIENGQNALNILCLFFLFLFPTCFEGMDYPRAVLLLKSNKLSPIQPRTNSR